jgi:hypothetical protein
LALRRNALPSGLRKTGSLRMELSVEEQTILGEQQAQWHCDVRL